MSKSRSLRSPVQHGGQIWPISLFANRAHLSTMFVLRLSIPSLTVARLRPLASSFSPPHTLLHAGDTSTAPFFLLWSDRTREEWTRGQLALTRMTGVVEMLEVELLLCRKESSLNNIGCSTFGCRVSKADTKLMAQISTFTKSRAMRVDIMNVVNSRSKSSQRNAEFTLQ